MAVVTKAWRDDVRIPGLRNEDPLDLALLARASASSEAALDFQRPETGWMVLHRPSFGRSQAIVRSLGHGHSADRQLH